MKNFFLLLVILTNTLLIHSQSLDWYNAFETATIYDNLSWNDLAFDQNNNVVKVGYFVGNVDSDPTGGVNTHSTSAPSILIQKVSTTGTILWTKEIIGSGILGVISAYIRTDNANNIYIGGFFENSADFDPGSGVVTLTANGIEDGFVLKLDENGNFLYVNQLRQGRAGELTRFEVNKTTQEVFYVTPFQQWIDVDPSGNNIILNEHPTIYNDHGIDNSVAICFNANGTYKWHYFLGTDYSDGFRGLYILQNSDVILMPSWNSTDSIDVDPSSNVFKLKNQSLAGGFQRNIVKINTNGIFISASQIHFNSSDVSNGYTYHNYDSNDNLILSGTFENTVNFSLNNGSFIKSSQGNRDGFILRYNSSYQIDTSYFVQGAAIQSIQYINVDKRNVLHIMLRSDAPVDVDQNPNSTVNLSGYNYLKLDNKDFSFIHSFPRNSDLSSPWLKNEDRKWVFFKNGMTNGESLEMDPTTANTTYTNWAQGNASVVCQWEICTSSTNSNVNITSCGSSYTSPSRKFTWTSNGTYQDTIYNHEGCDSIMTINLILDGKTYSSFSGYGCDSYTSPSGAVILNSGVYNDTIQNSNGCDSLITITVTLGEVQSEAYPVICDGETYTLPNGGMVTTTGDYNDTLQSSNNCDSIIIYHLTVNPTYHQNLTIAACQSYTLPSGVVVTQDGIYNEMLTASTGCDSSFTIDLTFGEVRNTEIVEECFEFVLSNGLVVETSGIYEDTLLSFEGCDSIVTYDVTINSFEITTINTSPDVVLTVFPSGADYQWLDCTDYSELQEETSQSFTATANGSYAAIVSLNGCTDTSNCLTVSTVGLDELNLPFIKIFPNPTTGVVTIDFPIRTFDEITIFDLSGRRVIDQEINKLSTNTLINLNQLSRGVYLISLTSKDNRYVRRIVLK
ncbi:MAG: hypothetical protein ACI9G9_000347 [Psychromonas sp.]|jgi:hypothetical protein